MEAHPALEGSHGDESRGKTPMVEVLTAATKMQPSYPIDWHQVDITDLESSGIPAAVGAALAPDPITVR
jgi:hypothetical protein